MSESRNSDTFSILREVAAERSEQHIIYKNLDKERSKNDWISYIVAYVGRAAFSRKNEIIPGVVPFRSIMVKAAIEAHDNGWLK